MNKKLSDEEIQQFKKLASIKTGQFSNYSVLKMFNTIEALKAEKTNILGTIDLLNECIASWRERNEAKDAQIKKLVEALEKAEPMFTYLDEEGCELVSNKKEYNFIEIAKQALSTIPDVEGYRLERDEHEAVKAWRLAYTDSDISEEDRSLANLSLYMSHLKVEAHREKVKNDTFKLELRHCKRHLS